jgi:RNA methyltransferase, TrmH family
MICYDRNLSIHVRSGAASLHVTSPQNPLIKEIRRAIAKGTLTTDGFCIVEGPHAVEEAIRSGCEIGPIIVPEPAGDRTFPGREVITVPGKLFDSISTTESPQGLLALVRAPEFAAFDQLLGKTALILIIDGIQDPGNAGAILRSAEAFGATGVVFLAGSVWPFNPKAIRASAGSVFRMPMRINEGVASVLEFLRANKVALYAAMPDPRTPVTSVDLTRRCAFAIGAEGRGVSTELGAAATPVHIPTKGVESLNAAVAAAILVYEAARQRGSNL